MKKIMLVSAILLSTSMTTFAAENRSTAMQVSTTITTSCNISANNVVFGNVTPNSTGSLTATGRFEYICSNGVSTSAKINAGSSGNIANRHMVGTSGNTDTLKYNVYLDNTYQSIWGDDNDEAGLYMYGDGVHNVRNIDAKLSLNQYVKEDNYSDNLVISVDF